MDSLDDLFAQAMAAARHEKKTKELKQLRRTAEKPEARDVRKVYQDPENWERTRGIALIHKDTQTLLGNFSEYVHKSVPNCRRLVREESPISIAAVEQYEGSWWLEEKRRPEPPQQWHTKRTVLVHLHLENLGVHCPACELVVCLSYGSISRVELAVDTQLAQENGSPEQMLFLPAGTNVLGEMSLDCKIAVRVELGQEEGK